MASDDDRVTALRRRIRTDPESVAVEALVTWSDADSATVRELRDVQDELSRLHPRPGALVQSALETVPAIETENRRHLLGLLLSMARARPRPVARTLCDALEDSRAGVRLAVIEVLAFTVEDWWGLLRPGIPAILTLLSDDDRRIRAPAAATLASLATPYPDAVRPAGSDATAMLDDPPVSTSAYGFREHQPVGRALELLAGLARHRSESVLSAVPHASRILREDDRFVEPAAAYLRHVARESPDALGPLAWLPDRADQLTGERRVAVLDLAHHVGVYDGPRVPVKRLERGPRDVQLTQADREYFDSVDDEPLPSLDIERVLSLLRAADVDARRAAVQLLFEPRTSDDAATIHAHAGGFLGLVDEPDDVTRRTMESVLSPVVARFAPEWLPALVDIARTGTAVERRFVSSLFSAAASTYPSGVRDHLDVVLELAERDSDTAVSIHTGWTLYHVATAYPEAIRPVTDTVLDIGATSRGITAKTVVELQYEDGMDADVFGPFLRQACRQLAAELDEPSAEVLFDPTMAALESDVHATPEGLCRVLNAVCLFAVSNPAAVEPVRSELGRIGALGPGESDDLDRARMLATSALVELDRPPSGDCE